MKENKYQTNHHFENVIPAAPQFRWLGGADRILRLQRLMDELEAGLRECPFCGANAVVYGCFTYASPCAKVRCTSCNCQTPIMIEGTELGSGKYQSLEDCLRAVVRTWNRRT